MGPWKRVEPTEVKKIGWRTVVTKNFLLPDNKIHEFHTINREETHSVGVIALTKDNQVITAYQYRPGPEKLMYEVPGGGVEQHDVDYQAAALRELREETGYVSDVVVHLGDIHKDAYNNGTWHYYFVADCELHEDGQDLDPHEYVDVRLITIDQLFENARSCLMTDTEAVFLAYDKLMDIRHGK